MAIGRSSCFTDFLGYVVKAPTVGASWLQAVPNDAHCSLGHRAQCSKRMLVADGGLPQLQLIPVHSEVHRAAMFNATQPKKN